MNALRLYSLLYPIDDILYRNKDNDTTFKMENDGNFIIEGDKLGI